MKTKHDCKAVSFVVLLLVAVLGLGAGMIAASAASADESGKTYYYRELKNSAMAQKFYTVLRDAATGGDLNDGVTEIDLIEKGVLNERDVQSYATGKDSKVAVALGAARDAFYMDNPDLFYIDVYKMRLTVGMQNGKYIALLGAGRTDTYYMENTVSDTAGVATAVAAYEKKIGEIVTAAKQAGNDEVARIKYVNAYLAQNIKYDYGSLEARVDKSVDTAYGGLVNGKALCEGYSRAYKAVLDRLGIPCVVVLGSARSNVSVDGLDPGYRAHAWNAVKVNGMWYGVDVTWNSTTGNTEKYLLVGNDFLSQTHVEDPVLSSSGFELKYPALRPLNYGINDDGKGFVFKDSGKLGSAEFGYQTNGKVRALVLGVSFNGKDAAQLKKDGLYLASRYTVKGQWSQWMCITVWEEYNGGYAYINGYTVSTYYPNTDQIQFAVFGYAPTAAAGNVNLMYTETDMPVAVSSAYINDAFGEYVAPPYVRRTIPNDNGYLTKLDAQELSIEYTETLAKIDENAEIGLQITGQHKDVDKYCTVENIRWDGDKTVTFTFTPSRSYAHDCEMYHIVPTNLVGSKSGKVPNDALFLYRRPQVVCSKVFNDGRLYMNVYGHPEFVGAEDMSLTGFKDESGKSVAGNQRSQLMLVINEPTDAERIAMSEKVQADYGVSAKDVKSSTYQIDLHVCGMVQKVPDGSYMQVGFGFPEGYGPQDAGIVFTVYHYTLDKDNNVTGAYPVPCVVTEYGIVATVKEFSPFAVCAVKTENKSDSKYLYAHATGEGGGIDKTTVREVKRGETVTVQIAAQNGYRRENILLNGKAYDNVTPNGTVTLSYDDLSAGGNELEISFISERAALHYTEANIELLAQPRYVVQQKDMLTAAPSEKSGGKKSRTGLIVLLVVLIVIVAAGVAVTLWFMLFKKNGNDGNDKGKRTKRTSRVSDTKKTHASSETQKTETVARGATKESASHTAPTSNTAVRPTTNTSRPAPTVTSRPASSVRPATAAARPTTNAPRTAPTTTRPATTARPATSQRPQNGNGTTKRSQ